MLEICHNIERVAQPVPFRNEGGDCFACAACAGLRFLYPEREFTLDDVWELFVVEFYDGSARKNLQRLREAVAPLIDTPKDPAAILPALQNLEHVYREVMDDRPKTTVGNTWPGFRKVLDKVSHQWGKLEIVSDLVEPNFDIDQWSCPWRFQDLSLGYARRLEGWLRGGWVAWTEVKHSGGGPFVQGEDGRVMLSLTDHFVLLDGVRYRYVAREGGGHWEDEVHVVDSSTSNLTGWYRTQQFTRSHGAGGWWLARRDVR